MTEPFPRVIGASSASQMNVEPLFSRDVRVIRRPVVERVEELGAAIDRASAAANEALRRAEQEAEKIRQEAREQGRAEAIRQSVEQLAAACKVRDDARADAEDEVLELAFALAARVIGRAVQLDRNALVGIVQERIAQLRNSSHIIVRVAPDAVAELEASRGQLLGHIDGVPLTFAPDPSLTGADCIIETDRGRADARIETQLRVLREALRAGATQ